MKTFQIFHTDGSTHKVKADRVDTTSDSACFVFYNIDGFCSDQVAWFPKVNVLSVFDATDLPVEITKIA